MFWLCSAMVVGVVLYLLLVPPKEEIIIIPSDEALSFVDNN